ncbi:hypothetical protein RhiLY_03807 [Ceratobasidium sp. AG-Ba]|nr:hypothetical protein RhiLY_03807 [Ceratobasidium sp. AG-Ba]
MSRPRPPLHDPYGLLRPPPPLESPRNSFYGVTSSNLGSTVSLPLPPASPGRRNRQRGVSPSRTQHGEEYDDQPYLTNVVRHHGQVTLVPPVNQGRARKIRRRRNPEAAASTTSLVEPGARPVSASGPSRLDAETPAAHRSPRRPRHGSDSRAVSSPDIHTSPYPDYPPPSFEEVLALDRAAAPATLTENPTESESNVPSPPLSVSDSFNLPANSSPSAPATTTPWEEDRRLGLSLEERVRRELERNLKPIITESSPQPILQTSNGDPSDNGRPPPSSGTPTSVAASNFLTPQNLTPSPLGIPLPLSNQTSPQVEVSEPRSPSPTAVPSKPLHSAASRPVEMPDLVAPQPTSGPQAHTLGLLDNSTRADSPRIPHQSEQAHSPKQVPQTLSQGNQSTTPGPLASLLFTTKLNIDEPSTIECPSGSTEPVTDRALAEGPPPITDAGKGKSKEITSECPTVASSTLDRAATPRAASPQKAISRLVALYEPSTSSSYVGSTLKSPAPSRPISLKSPIKTNEEFVFPSPGSSSKPVIEPSPVSLPRKPPPPPPRPRPISAGTGIAARVSAYEAILANAPKVPPPIPPRPRDRQQASSSTPNAAPERGPTKLETDASTKQLGNHTHIAVADTPKPRPTSLLATDAGPSRLASRPLPIPPAFPVLSITPDRAKRDASPERPKSPTKQVQVEALVPARIGPDGKLEIIPDAEVIWLDENKPSVVEGLDTRRERSDSRAQLGGLAHNASVQPAEVAEPVAGPSTRRIPPPPPIPNAPMVITSSPVPSPVSVEPADSNPFSPPADSSPALPATTVTNTPRVASSPRLADDFEYTDLDLLISRLEENEAARQGANYEQLLTVGEVLGPAIPHTRAELDLNVGLIEIQRRRVMKDGRVKLKLSLMGISVDKCGICLTQFKNNDSAVLLPCLHNYHTNCIMSWLVRQDVPACPHCRAPV